MTNKKKLMLILIRIMTKKNKEACSNAGGEKQNHDHNKINMLHKKRFQKVVQNSNLALIPKKEKLL